MTIEKAARTWYNSSMCDICSFRQQYCEFAQQSVTSKSRKKSVVFHLGMEHALGESLCNFNEGKLQTDSSDIVLVQLIKAHRA